MPDGKSIVIWSKGKIIKVDIASQKAIDIPFHVHSTQRITDAVRFPQDVSPANFEARLIRQGVTSPDDKTFVFSAVGHLWKKTLPAGAPVRLTKDTDFEYWPSFSRDGKSIVYTTWNDEKGGVICRMSAGGGGKKVLTKRAGFYRAPTFSPDGTKIVFERNEGNVRLGTNNGTEPGIYWMPADGGDAETVLQHADVAMYAAKHSRAGVMRYRRETDPFSPDRLRLLADLYQAVDGEQFELFYQPKVEIATGRVIAAEALLRWRHPRRGRLDPDTFIQLAEPTGLIVPITTWVVRTALAQLSEWEAEGIGTDLDLAVNLSAHSLHDRSLAVAVHDVIVQSGIAPHRVTLEVTESAVTADASRAQAVLEGLARGGVRIAIDDFGTGYTSLSQVGQLPVHELKVDKTFVLGMLADHTKRAIVASIVELGRSLGLDVVAEGAETSKHWEMLRTLGCRIGQGYFVSPPLPAAEFRRWLGEREGAVFAADDDRAPSATTPA
jgi:EAL domain-containing protein (putative c-di-GMP-specific phosphodiesterase class I)